MSIIKVKKLHPDAKLPTRTHDGDAGYDLHILDDVTIPPGEIVKAKTGIAIELPDGYWGFIKERSSTALKGLVVTVAGVVDNGYRGEIILGLFNTSEDWAHYEAGSKVAQIIPISLYDGDIIEVNKLGDSSRGHGGFGSTGS